VIKTGIKIFGHVISQGVVISLIAFLLAVIAILVVIILFIKRKFYQCDVLAKRLLSGKKKGKKIKIDTIDTK